MPLRRASGIATEGTEAKQLTLRSCTVLDNRDRNAIRKYTHAVSTL